MNSLTNDLANLIQQDFEVELSNVFSQMTPPPADATVEQTIHHVGPILYRLAFLKGLSVGVETSQMYIR